MIGTPETRYAARRLREISFAEQRRRLSLAAFFDIETMQTVLAQARQLHIGANAHLKNLLAQHAASSLAAKLKKAR